MEIVALLFSILLENKNMGKGAWEMMISQKIQVNVCSYSIYKSEDIEDCSRPKRHQHNLWTNPHFPSATNPRGWSM